jgi:hypothetical protein
MDVVAKAHVQAVLQRKARGTRSALLARLLSLGETARAYVEGMVGQELRLSLHVKRIVGLIDLYGKEEVTAAMEKAISYGAFGSHYVQHLLIHGRRRENRPPPLQPLLFPDKPEIESLSLPERDLAEYDRLLARDAGEEE